MDVLSAIGLLGKRKDYFFSQAQALAKKAKNQENLERLMADESRAIVRGFQYQQIKFDEYQRTLMEKTLISALAAVYLGSGKNQKKNMEESFPVIVGEMIPPLLNFTDETKLWTEDNVLKFKDDSEEPSVQTHAIAGEPTVGRTWNGVTSRVSRYLSSPSYGYSLLGDYLTKKSLGFREMRRIPINDGKTCLDCKKYEEMGWAPLGELPLPGKECQCYDRCRCKVEYR
jgi:hypothetical protein